MTRHKNMGYTNQMRRGLLEFVILLLLKKKALNAQEILKSLEDTEFKTPSGTLYPLMSKLVSDGLIESSLEESDRTGRYAAMNYFYLTEKGEARLNEMKQYWRKLKLVISSFS
jgi:PadR family transcriptional regulator PadR